MHTLDRMRQTDREVERETTTEEHESGHKERDSSEWYKSETEVKQSSDFTEKHKRNTHPHAACRD